MTRTERALATVALAAALGCHAATPSAPPRPLAAEPAQGFERSETTIDIVGSAFHVRAVQRAQGGSSVDASYRAWLGTAELRDVAWIDSARLRARVPAGLPLGRHDLTVEGPYGRGTAAGAYEVLPGSAPSLAATLAVAEAASVGQEVVLGVTVENGGDVTIQAVRADAALGGPGALALVTAATPQDLAPGARQTFTLVFRAEVPGAVAISVSAVGRDPRTGADVVAAATGGLRVERPAALSAALALPAGPLALGDLPVTITVTNTGEATALAVLPSSLVDDASTGAASIIGAPAQAVTLPGGETASFTWPCRAVASGTLTLTATVMGVDANDGRTLSAIATSATATIPHGMTLLATDPFADGSTFAFVAPYRGQVYVGPSRVGTGVIRMKPDGSMPESLALSFPRDGVGNVSGNTTWPHASIGFTGCATTACGPDGEDGRGLLTSVSFAGDEWLLLGGARSSGDLDYVYLSAASASPLAFSFVDLSQVLGGNTRGFSAAHASGGRLYLGFPDNGGSRPYGIALLAAPTGNGLDAIQGQHALDLNLHDAYAAAYGGTFAGISMVDAIADLGGHVYFFDDVGCLVSTGSAPATKDDFRGCSPAIGATYVQSESVVPARQYDLEPRDKAWPQAVVWNGRLYAIRNTTEGPQLWSCAPAGGADPAVCDPTDWTLLAADPATHRTRLGNADVTSASMLLATAKHLYVGLDDPVRGLHVFRTRAAVPGVSDFRGGEDCVAGTAGCEGLGGDGLGAPAFLTRILDAKVVTAADGRVDLLLTAGNGSSPFRLIRMDP